MPPVLWLQHLSVGIRHGKGFLPAVEDVSLRIEPGQIVGLVGESGCGKSLTALSCAGLLPEAARVIKGKVLFEGIALEHMSQRELCGLRGSGISLVFQEPMTSLNPLMRIGRQVAEPLLLHGWSGRAHIRGEVIATLARVGLPEPEKLLGAYPHQLSGGMQQRVMIAIALIGRPRLLIADEPTTALDVTTQAQILGLFKKINRETGTAILFISHDLNVVGQICDRVAVMYAGRIVEEGSVGNIFWHPVHEYTKALMGSIPTKRQKGKRLVTIPGKVPSIEDEWSGCPYSPRCPVAREVCFNSVPEHLDLSEHHRVWCFLADPESEMEYVRI
jgi:peptide/nickel transport system ATP-binding protein